MRPNSVVLPPWLSVTAGTPSLPAANANVASTTVRKKLSGDSAKMSTAG